MAKNKQEEVEQSKNPIQRAWAAGVFDARITVSPREVSLKMESADQALVNRFHKVVGTGTVLMSERKGKQHPLQFHIWRTYSIHDAWLTLRFVLPLLSPRKKKQALANIKKIESTPSWLKRYGHLSITRKPIMLPESTDKPADPDFL